MTPRGGPPQESDEAVHVRLGANPDTPPASLWALATDPRLTVRAAVALNPASSVDTDRMLARDGDARVRTLLGRKLAQLIPGMARGDRALVREQALDVLAGLVEDEAVRVRSAIADVVKDMPEAPRALIVKLAHDSAVPVCDPVIRLSPLLTPEDLLSLLAAPPSAATATAIARRANLDEAVSDAIAATADNAAIAALLHNDSAAIREATLDALVARASWHQEWHDPLVHRPMLTSRAARALSEIVTTHLLAVLAGRPDLDPAMTAELRLRLDARLAQATDAPGTAAAVAEDPSAKASRLRAEGRLTEAAVLDAACRGDMKLCVAMLALAADVAPEVVERSATLRSAKGLVSLVWAAGFSMTLASALQCLLGKLSPTSLLHPTAYGGFPLVTEEMRWQVDMLKRALR